MRIMVLHQAPQQPSDVEPHRKVEAMLRGYASPGTELDSDLWTLCVPASH